MLVFCSVATQTPIGTFEHGFSSMEPVEEEVGIFGKARPLRESPPRLVRRFGEICGSQDTGFPVKPAPISPPFKAGFLVSCGLYSIVNHGA